MEDCAPHMSRADWEMLLKANFAGWSTRDPEKVRHMYDRSSASYFFDIGHPHRDFDEYAREAAKRMQQQLSSFEVELKELLSVVRFQGGNMVTTVDICTVRMQKIAAKEPEQFEVLHTVVWWRHPGGPWLIVHEHQSRKNA